MALSQEQRALLQLVLGRGQSYADIASLLGGDEESVRARAQAALAELAGEDPDAEAPLTDYLLGQADPIDRADAVRLLQRSPETHALASGLASQLALVVPDADLPELPAQRSGARSPRAPRGATAGPTPAKGPAQAPRTGSWENVPQNRLRMLIALIAGAILAITVSVVVVSQDGDDDGGGASTSTTAGAQNELARLERSFRDPIKLRRVDDGPPGASGQVSLGTLEEQFGMTIEATKLKPSEGDQFYVPWLYNSRAEALPLADGKKADKNGKLSLVGLIRADLLPILTRFASIDVSLETKRRVERHSGRSVLRGKVPGGGGGLGEDTGTGTGTTPTPQAPAAP